MNWLEQIGCYFLSAVAWLLGGIVWLLNQLISALGAIASTALALLPDFPELPGAPSAVVQGASVVNWLIPVGTLLTVLTLTVTLWFIWLGVSAALRWVKAYE